MIRFFNFYACKGNKLEAEEDQNNLSKEGRDKKKEILMKVHIVFMRFED